MKKDTLVVEQQGVITILRFNRPPANTLDPELCQAVQEAFQALPRTCRAVIMTGNEKFFSAGANIRMVARNRPKQNEAYFSQIYALMQTIYDCPLPTIAAVNGVAMGAGMELALCCDLRVVDEDLRMGATSANMGLVFCTQRLPRLIGMSKATELLFTARTFNGKEAQSLGIAHDVTFPGQAFAKALEWAHTVSQKPFSCLQNIKQALHEGMSLPLSTGLQREQERLFEALRNAELEEQVKKFLERKKEGKEK